MELLSKNSKLLKAMKYFRKKIYIMDICVVLNIHENICFWSKSVVFQTLDLPSQFQPVSFSKVCSYEKVSLYEFGEVFQEL